MASQAITIKLTQPYTFTAADERALNQQTKSPNEFAREVSDGFINLALRAIHGQELDRKTAKAWARIKRELDRGEDTITLDGTSWEWLADLFFTAKAEEAVKIRPEHAVWWFQWLDALEDVRTAAKAESVA